MCFPLLKLKTKWRFLFCSTLNMNVMNVTCIFQSEQGPGGKGYARNVAPRFQKQQESAGGQGQRQQPLSPGSGGGSPHPVGPPMPGFRPGQGPPPPPWAAAYDPRWSGMPHFIDPRYGPRPPLDMQGGWTSLREIVQQSGMLIFHYFPYFHWDPLFFSTFVFHLFLLLYWILVVCFKSLCLQMLLGQVSPNPCGFPE